MAGLPTSIVQANTTIGYAYTVGIVASLVAALTMVVHAPTMLTHPASFAAYAVRPMMYSILFAELWFRPFKKRMEMMLQSQLAA